MTFPTREPDAEPEPSREPAAFERFYAAHVASVVSFAARRSASGQEVADIVAATFVRAIEHANTYDRSRGTPKAWLMGICANVQRDAVRRSVREQALIDRLRHQVPLTTDDVERFEAQIQAAQMQPELDKALDRLRPSQREVLELVAVEGMTTREAAAALGISTGAVRVRLSRARRNARAALSRLPEPETSTPRPDSPQTRDREGYPT